MTMAEETPQIKRVARAAGILKLAKKNSDMNVHTAMKFAGFDTPQADDKALRRKVYRKRDQLKSIEDAALADKEPPPPPQFTAQSLKLGEKIFAEKVHKAGKRLTMRQKGAARADQARSREKTNQLYKIASLRLKDELIKKEAAAASTDGFTYKAKSAETIAREMQEESGFKLCARTIRNCVSRGDAGKSPLRRGPKGRIEVSAFKALCGAVMSYCTITQALGTKTVDRPRLIRMVNTCVNMKEGAESRKDRWLFDRVQNEIGNVLELGKPDRVEQRRNKWSTHSNTAMWYDSFKSFLIEKGFGKEITTQVGLRGEIDWVDDTQGHRIANIDESGMVLDDTSSGKGGRPAAVFYNPRLSKEAIHAAHKNSFHCTLLAGTFASGEKIPEHFQLPSDCQDPATMGIYSDFIINMVDTWGQFLFDEYGEFSNSYSSNKKGGMNKEEFGKWIDKNFIKLVANDSADRAGKRVCLLVDGGPGRTNKEMYQKLRMLGVYLFPSGPPNTTHILQIMDMLFGYFKTIYFTNLEKLWEYRQNIKGPSTLTRNDIGVLTYGSARRCLTDPSFPELRNAAEEAFSIDRTQHAWANKLGVYPKFTREALNDKKIRHELVVNAEGKANTDADPQAAYLQEMNAHNTMCCDILDCVGYNGDLFRIQMPEFVAEKRQERVTKPRTRERQEALENARGVFQVTGGAALNDDDFLIRDERLRLKAELQALQKTKKKMQLQWDRQQRAFEIIEAERPKLTSTEYRDLIAWKTSKPCPSKITSLKGRKELYLQLKDMPVKNSIQWSLEDEAKLILLKEKIESDIALEDTEFGRDRELATSKAKALVNSLPEDERLAFSQDLVKDCIQTLSDVRFDNTDSLLAGMLIAGSDHPTEDMTERSDEDFV